MADAIDVCSVASAPVIADHTYMARNDNILRPAPISTQAFTTDTDLGMMVGEMSSTHGFGRVYRDACDEGLTLVSHRTGREVVYAVVETKRDREGDLLYWTLRPADPSHDFLPPLRIYND